MRTACVLTPVTLATGAPAAGRGPAPRFFDPGAGEARASASRRGRRLLGRDPEPALVLAVEGLPVGRNLGDAALSGLQRAVEQRRQRLEAYLPACRVAGRLEAVAERVREHEHAAVVVGSQLPAELVLAPFVGQDAGRLVVEQLAVGHLHLATGKERDGAPGALGVGPDLERGGM